MKTYHKIQTVFKRNPETKFKTLLFGKFSLSEFEYLANNDWVWTEKVDGTNIRVLWDGKTVIFGGKTDNAQIPSILFNNLNIMFTSEMMFNMFGKTPVCLYGEGYGKKIQKGGGDYNSKTQSFVLFDVKIDNWWLQRESITNIASKLNIKIVPIIGQGSLWNMVKIVKEGFNSQWGAFLAEGIVARPVVELLSRSGSRIITKIKHKDFTK